MGRRTNIPIRVLKDNKNRSCLELVAFAVLIFSNSNNGVLYDFNVRGVMSLLGCGYKKAVSLIDRARSSSMFHVWSKGGRERIRVNSLKDKTEKVTRSGKGTYKGEYCLRYCAFGKRMREVVRDFQKALVENAIQTRSRVVSKGRGAERQSSTELVSVSGNTLERAVGLSRVATYKLIRELVESGELVKEDSLRYRLHVGEQKPYGSYLINIKGVDFAVFSCKYSSRSNDFAHVFYHKHFNDAMCELGSLEYYFQYMHD